MKRFLAIFFIILIAGCENPGISDASRYYCDFDFQDDSAIHPKAAQFQAMLNDLTHKGTVGINMSFYNPISGRWLGSAGKADIYNDVQMQPCMISRMGSTIKVFTATVVLMLFEEDKLVLDDKLSDYLSEDYIHEIPNAESATIRQLLQHSSGIYNYIQSPYFQTASLNDLKKEWKAEDLLHYAYHRDAYFDPGTDVRYSNTNYILLGLLIEKIENKPLQEVFKERIFTPLGMPATLFAAQDPVPHNIVRGYIDLYNNYKVTESTYYSGWDYYTADGGLISNPYEMSLFFEKLLGGEVLPPNILQEMLTWKTPSSQEEDFFHIEYGLGIFKMHTPQGEVYYHSGDAIGYYANMMYVPSTGSFIVYAVNSNYGKLDEWISTKKGIENILENTW